MRPLIVFFAFFSFSLPIFASVKVEVVAGHLLSQFEFVKSGSGSRLEFENSNGVREIRKLAIEDYKFFVEKVLALPKKSNDLSFCPNLYIRITMDKLNRTACIGSETKIAKDMEALVQLLRIQI